MDISVKMQITMAEVAVFISTVLVLANCRGRKGETAEGCIDAKRCILGLRKICAELPSVWMERRSGECNCYALCRSDTGIFIYQKG